MRDKRENISAEKILNSLANILAEQDPIESCEETDKDAMIFVEKGMEMVNEWRREYKMGIGREKMEKFRDFLNKITRLSEPNEIRQAIMETINPFESQQRLVFYSRLKKITDKELISLDNDAKILELWTFIFKEVERE